VHIDQIATGIRPDPAATLTRGKDLDCSARHLSLQTASFTGHATRPACGR
jgi:hypothetical protein